jgi:hypothetical protein
VVAEREQLEVEAAPAAVAAPDGTVAGVEAVPEELPEEPGLAAVARA